MAGQPTPRKSPPSPNGAPTLTPLGHYAGRPDIAISRQVTVVGSKQGSRLHLASSTVSQSHAIIVNSVAGPYIRDLASRTHVLVNGKERREADLTDGDLLQIGKFKFQFNEGAAAPARIGDHDPAPGAVLVIDGGEMPVPFDGRAMLIGRRPTSDIPLVEDSVSTGHAVIFEMNGKRFIRDLGSRTGTLVNGTPVEQAELNFGDEIHIGETRMVYNPASHASMGRGHDVDEMDHLVSTAPLGTPALDELAAADFEVAQQEAIAPAAEEDDEDDAIPIEPAESAHGRAPAAAEPRAAPAAPAPPPPAPPDEVRLDNDPDVSGSGPGDTAKLPPIDVEESPSKRPTLKARLVPDAPPPPPPLPPPPSAAPPAEAEGGDIEDALGLTPEARRREQAKADDLGGSRRGWRGMSSEDISLPLGMRHAPPAPAAAPAIPPPSQPVDEAPPAEEAPAEAEAEVETPTPPPDDNEAEIHELDELVAEALRDEPPPAAAEPAPPPAAEIPTEGEEDPDQSPVAAEAPAEVPEANVAPADEFVVDEVEALEEEEEASPAPAAAAPAAPVIEPAKPAAGLAPTPATPKPVAQDTPPHVTIGEEVEPDPLPAETFEIDPEVDDRVAVPLAEHADADDELHLPPVIDETLGSEDVLDADIAAAAFDVPTLPLTPEEGGEIDLSVDETPSIVDEPAPALDFSESEEGLGSRMPGLPLAASRTQLDSSGEEPAASDATPSAKPPLDVARDRQAAEPAAEPVEEKSKRKRASRKKKDAAPEPVELEDVAPPPPLPVVEAAPAEPEPDPEPAPIAEAPRETVEVLEETQPTPESALDIDDAVAAMLNEPLAPEEPADSPDVAALEEAAAMTDSTFGRAIDAFSGESTGPLVEAREEKDEPLLAPPAEEAVAAAAAAAAAATEEAEAKDDKVKSIDELIADVFTSDTVDVGDEAPQEIADRNESDVVAELDKAIEEAAGAAPAFDVAPSADEAAIDLEPVAEAPAAEAQAEKAEARPQEVAESLELVAEAPQDGKSESPTAPPPPPPQPPARPPVGGWGANQDHFLGGMPLRLNKPVEPAPIGQVGVSFDKPPPVYQQPAAAGPAASAPASPPQAPPPPPPGQAPPRGKSPLFMPPPPPRATRPNARTRSGPLDITPGDAPTQDAGASIPPFSGGGSPKAGQITTGFDGLAMPPVRQTDVFSQMSTPAAFANGLAGGGYDDDDNDIFARGAKLAAARGGQAPPTSESATSPAHADAADNEAPPPPPPPGSAADADADAAAAAAPSPADDVWADAPAATDAEESDEQGEPAAAAVAAAAAVPTNGARRAARVNGAGPPPAAAPAKRKRRWFGLRLMLVLMLLCGIGAAAGIYGFVKKQTNVVGVLRFDNFPTKTIEQQDLLQKQKELLGDQSLREAARSLLARHGPGVAPGFLGSAPQYEGVVKAADWSAEGPKGALALPYAGRDEAGDKARVRAVMIALYEANGKNAGDSVQLAKTVRELTAAHEKSQQRVNELKEQIEKLGAAAQRVPDRKQVEELTGEVARLDKAYNEAVRRVKDLSIDVEHMRRSMPANPQPAGTAQAPVVDPELAQLQEDLAATQMRIADSKAGRAKAADAARVALDEALDAFQKQVEGAKGVSKDNPELSAYVAAASKLQTSTRDLTDQLIRRQQEQQHRLAELKTRLGEKLEARRADAWKKDPKLRELSDQLEIVRRQHGAAVGGGAKKEADEFKSQIDLLEQMIKARQTLVGDDAFYADAINQLEKIIDTTQRGLDDDRKRTETVLEEMQAGFKQSQPAVEKMPAAQKELAALLEKQLTDISSARRQYTAAADAQAAAADDELKKMEASAAELTAKINERRKALAADAAKAATAQQEQQRAQALKDREAELAASQTAESETRTAWDAAQRKLRDAQSVETEAREAAERRDGLIAQRMKAEKELEQNLRKLESNREVLGKTAIPIPPTDEDVKMSVHDPRPVYALASVGGIVAVFTLLILLTSPGSGGGPPPAIVDDVPMANLPFDREPPRPQPRSGADNGHADAADEARLAM